MSEAEAAVANPPAEVKEEEVKAEPSAPAAEPAAVSEETKTEAAEPAIKDESAQDEKPADSEPQKGQSANILKTKGKIDFDNKRNNRKFDPSVREVTDDPVAIRKQVEFYFGDWNFPQDKFMWEQCEGAENKPIAIQKIHSFKRMRTFQPYSAVVAALRDSDFLVVDGEEGEETVKRKNAYKPMATGKAKAEAATVYVKGFGDEEPNTQFDLETFFSQFGDVRGLKLRRTQENFFKGSVFVTFADENEAQKFIALDPAPKWKDHDLKIMSKREYCQEKTDLIRQGKLEPNSQSTKKFFEGKDGSNKPRDNDDWKKRREHDQKNGFRDNRGGFRGRGGRGRGGGGRGRGRGGRDNYRDRDGGRDAPRDAAYHDAKANDER
jgi:lupus La protein